MENTILTFNGTTETLDLSKMELSINGSTLGTNIMTINLYDYKYKTELLDKISKEGKGVAKLVVGIDEIIPETEVQVSVNIFVASTGIRKVFTFNKIEVA